VEVLVNEAMAVGLATPIYKICKNFMHQFKFTEIVKTITAVA
jgi:hypothetical protein